ncbi:Z1 domain-containing protein, partial [bacterium]|nr:Z1 domain-containing protein [bacterium]
ADTLDYREAEIHLRNLIQQGEDVPWYNRGASVIAIGGDKLSRGLTLDGLSISYYLRVSTMYDTLMQMGRWFGYRDGYNDLCRIYTTEELRDWYRFIAGSMVELRNELNYMALQNTDPLHFGLRVRNHPGRLAITSAQKRRDAEMIQISFAGRSQETVVFDPQFSVININALENLIQRLGPSSHLPVDQSKPRYQWKEVSAETVMLFLHEYRTHDEAAVRVNPDNHANFIENQTSINELIEWDVVIISRATPLYTVTLADIEIGCVTRNALDIRNDKISIRRLLSPADQLLDLSEDELRNARIQDGLDVDGNAIPRPNTIRRVRPPERGLLLIYVCHGERGGRTYGEPGNEILGYGLSFPYSDNTVPTEFLANPVYIDQQ